MRYLGGAGGINPREMMAIYAAEKWQDPLKEEKGMLDIENAELTRLQKIRSLNEPSEADRAETTRQMEAVRYTISKYTDMIHDEKLSPTAREVYKGMLKNYASTIPKEYLASVGPALAYSPIDPVADGMDRFERLYPRPMPPQVTEQTGPGAWRGGEAPRDETNEVAWARHDIAQAEWKMRYDMMRDKLSGINPKDDVYKMPTLFQGSTPDSYWYKDKTTGQIGNINMKYIPQGELEAAINKYNWSLPDFMRTGMYPLDQPKTETLGDTKYSVKLMRDITNGKILVDRVPLGPKEASAAKSMPNDLQDALSVANMDLDEELLKSPTAIATYRMIQETKEKIGTPEGKAAMDKTNAMLSNQFGYVIAPYDKEVETTLRSRIPGIGGIFKQYTMKDGTFMAIPVRETPVPLTNERGEVILAYYNDAIKMAFDANLKPIWETRGVDLPRDPKEPTLIPGMVVEPRTPPALPPKDDKEVEPGETLEQYIERTGWVPDPIKILKSFRMEGKTLEEYKQHAKKYKEKLESKKETK